MTLTDVLLLVLVALAATGLALALVRGADPQAPRRRRVAVTTTEDETFVGFLAHEDRHRLVLEDAALQTAAGEQPAKGRQHFPQARVYRVQELSD